MSDDIQQWIVLAPRPVGVGFPPGILSVDNPLTPDTIRLNFNANCKVHETIVWSNGQHCGVKIEDHEIAWRPEEGKLLDIFFVRPAKGNGCVSLAITTTMRSMTIFVADYSDEILEWTREIVLAIKNVSTVEIRETDNGFDA